jgi:hypothetical protein
VFEHQAVLDTRATDYVFNDKNTTKVLLDV